MGHELMSENLTEDVALLAENHRDVNRRSKLETYLDIIKVLSAGAQLPTHVMYKANLSWVVLHRYMKRLEALGLIEKKMEEENTFYTITQKGISLQRQYRLLRDNMLLL